MQLQAQNAPLNKQQTIDYISKTFKASYYFKDVKIDNLNVDGKMLNINLSDGTILRYNILDYETVTIEKLNPENQFYIYNNSARAIFFHIQTEEDAKRLKKALEHLIEILKTEKNIDPFGE